MENVLADTKFDWMRNITSGNISKLGERQKRFFGTCSPAGTPNSSTSDEMSSRYAIEIDFNQDLGSPSGTTTLRNLSKLEERQTRFFQTWSPAGTPSSSSSCEVNSRYGIEIDVYQNLGSPYGNTTFKGKFGSPTVTPTSSDEF